MRPSGRDPSTSPSFSSLRLSAGLRALHEWLVTVEPGATDSFYLKLFVGGLTTTEALRAHLEQFQDDAQARLSTYREIEPTNENRGHDWFHRHLLRLGIARAELDLAWADDVLRALARQPR